MGISRGQRNQLYVSRSIQGVVMGRFALYWIGYHFTLWHGMLLYGYFRGNLLSSYTLGGGMSFWDYYARFFAVNNGILLSAAAICPLLLWDTLRVTHRIAGPIVRFKAVLKRLTRGERVEKIALRENDLLKDLRDEFNAFLASRESGSSDGQADPKEKAAAIDQLLNEVADEEQSKEKEEAAANAS